VAAQPVAQGIQQVGGQLFSTWLVPFEIASLVLLVALIGAVVIARTEDEQ
jgi:NADH-quinone oxidoreductase subunit J